MNFFNMLGVNWEANVQCNYNANLGMDALKELLTSTVSRIYLQLAKHIYSEQNTSAVSRI